MSYGWTEAGDLTALAHDLNGSANDVTFDATNGFDEGHRLTKETVSNALYRWTGTVTGSTAYSPDRLNRYASVGGTGFSYDANANLASDGTWTFGYDPENWLLTAAKTGTSASYLYDPLGRRVKSTVGSGSTVFLHADDEEIGGYGAGGGLQLRSGLGIPRGRRPLYLVVRPEGRSWPDSTCPRRSAGFTPTGPSGGRTTPSCAWASPTPIG